MDHTSTFAISAAGMALERARVEVAALNLANANAAQSPGHPAYQPLQVIARSAPSQSFAAYLAGDVVVPSPPTVQVQATSSAPRMVHEPANPLADARGFVSYPAVDTAAEMVSLMSATRAYEANVAAMNAAKTLALKALDIGGTA